MKKKRKAKSKDLVKKEYSYFAVHQLKSSLSSVAWSMEMILGGTFGNISQSQEEIIKKSYKEIKEALLIANRILDIHYIEKEKIIYHPTLCDIGELVQSVIDEYQYKILGKKIKFSFNKSMGHPVKTMVNYDKIRVVIENLLNNALKYTGEGGSIKISLQEENGNIKFEIRDSGIGIKEEDKDKLFKKFFKGSNTVLRNISGSGLGLFIAKKIIISHKGKIWFESKEGEGSTFYFTLPILHENYSHDKIKKKIIKQ